MITAAHHAPDTSDIEARPVLSVPEAAALLGISPWLLLQQTRRGTIPHRRIGRRVVYSRQRLLDWLGAENAATNDVPPVSVHR